MSFTADHLLSLTPGTTPYSDALQRYRLAMRGGDMDALLALTSLATELAFARGDDPSPDDELVHEVFDCYHKTAYQTGAHADFPFGTAVHAKYNDLRHRHAGMSEAAHSCLEHELGNGVQRTQAAVDAGIAPAAPLLRELRDLHEWHQLQHVARHFWIDAGDADLVGDFTVIWRALRENHSADDRSAAQHVVLKWSLRDDISLLEKLAMHLSQTLTSLVMTSSAGVLLTQVMHLLIEHEDSERAAVAMRVLHRYEAAGVWGELRSYAALLAEHKPVADMVDLLGRDDGNSGETWAVLLHEYVLRGHTYEAGGVATDFLRTLRDTGHPLAVLPARLLPPETGLLDLVYEYPAAPDDVVPNTATSFGPSRADAGVGDRRALTSALRSLRTSALGWGNAKVMAETYAFSEPQSVTAVHPDSLSTLPFEPFQRDNLVVSQIGLPTVYRELFGSAARGGIYDSGQRNAYGRLAMWQSVAALAGVPMTSIDDVSEAARACTWWSFTSDWFYRMYSMGYLAMRPDGGSMAVLAVDDYD